MKAKTFENLIRKVVREEIDYSLRREIKSLKEDLRDELKPTIVEHTERMVEVPKEVKQSLKDPDWAEVGMNPNKFGYFYIKSTGQKILTSPEVLQVGPVMVARIYQNGQQVATMEDTAYSRLKGTTGISRQFAQTADRIVQEQLASNF